MSYLLAARLHAWTIVWMSGINLSFSLNLTKYLSHAALIRKCSSRCARVSAFNIAARLRVLCKTLPSHMSSVNIYATVTLTSQMCVFMVHGSISLQLLYSRRNEWMLLQKCIGVFWAESDCRAGLQAFLWEGVLLQQIVNGRWQACAYITLAGP